MMWTVMCPCGCGYTFKVERKANKKPETIEAARERMKKYRAEHPEKYGGRKKGSKDRHKRMMRVDTGRPCPGRGRHGSTEGKTEN